MQNLTDYLFKIAEATQKVSTCNVVLAGLMPDGSLFLDEMVGAGHSVKGAVQSREFRGGMNAEEIDYDLMMAGFYNT